MQLVPGNKTSERDGGREDRRRLSPSNVSRSALRGVITRPSLYLRIDDDKEVQCTLDALLRKQMTSFVVEGKMWESKQPHIIDEVVIFFKGSGKTSPQLETLS